MTEKMHVCHILDVNFPGGGGYSKKNWVGVCGPLPKTLTLFMTKICDFPHALCVEGDGVEEGRARMGERMAFTKKNPNRRVVCKNRYPIMTKMAEKQYPLGLHIPI